MSSCMASIPLPMLPLKFGWSSQLGERGGCVSSRLEGLRVRGEIDPRRGLGERLPELGLVEVSKERGRLGFGREWARIMGGAESPAPVLLDLRWDLE